MTIERKPAKPKKCRVATCRASFVPSRMGQAVCSPACAMIDAPRHEPKARKALADIERKDIKVRKEKLKSRADHLKDTQHAFNAWIRARDAGQPCVSCGTTADVQYCAGHYRTTAAAPELRFEPLNVHLQCNRNCNMGKSGNLLGYRPRLLEKIGAEKLAWLEGPHEPKKHTVEQLKAMTAEYRAKTRELKRAAA
ncbi:bacteriophage lambda NinG family protein [Pseudomonas antarctica]|uniref:Bacteriophage lambda NinG family protein n=1 Tax=Pseudomonas antarctica TaxID=219572 RepID=A0A172Z596_9PSED|nr:recombination protein NinG [Pseudomonas antarctica]ANF87159.1 bacteriophage lambda NinG family protein [Pseudomonas antarctica]